MISPRYLFFLGLLAAGVAQAQPEREWLETAQRQEAALNEGAAFETLKVAVKVNPSSYPALWKLSELCSRIGKRQSQKEQQLAYYRLGKSYAERAVTVNPSGADGYYVLAVAMGRMAMTQSGKERVHSVKDIRTYIEKALQLNPSHGRAWHVLGKWHYEVSNLGMFEKAALRIVYGGLPPASLSESISCYERARQLEPDFALNYLELAKAYHKNNQDDKARECLRRLATVPLRTGDDAHIKQEGARMLKEWS
ncbi:tetratricopeptide repeat protein [Flaviaesturariibacter terrae]